MRYLICLILATDTNLHISYIYFPVCSFSRLHLLVWADGQKRDANADNYQPQLGAFGPSQKALQLLAKQTLLRNIGKGT